MSKTKLSDIYEAVSVEPGERTQEQLETILNFVQDVAFISQLAYDQQIALCKVMRLERIPAKEAVFYLGDHGDKYYIILMGLVAVQTPNKSARCPSGIHNIATEDCYCPGREVETYAYLKEQQGFGDLALQTDAPRAATIICTEDSEFLVTTRDNYQAFAHQIRNMAERRAQFLRMCGAVAQGIQRGEVGPHDLAIMAQVMHEVSIGGPKMICKQGEPADMVYLVRSGQLLQVRAVDAGARKDANAQTVEEEASCLAPSDEPKKTARRRSQDAPSSSFPSVQDDRNEVLASANDKAAGTVESPKESDTPKKKKPKVLLQVGKLSSHGVFGFNEVINGESWGVSLVSDPVAEIYTISKQDVLRKFSKKVQAALAEATVEMHHTDAMLMQMHRQTQRWNAYTSTVVAEISHDEEKTKRNDILLEGFHGEEEAESPRRRISLNFQEEEFYSDLPTRSLRRMQAVRQDPSLQVALRRTGHHIKAAEVQAQMSPPVALGMAANRHDASRNSEQPKSKDTNLSWDPTLFLVRHWFHVAKDNAGLSGLGVVDDVSVELAGPAPEDQLTSQRARQKKATLDQMTLQHGLTKPLPLSLPVERAHPPPPRGGPQAPPPPQAFTSRRPTETPKPAPAHSRAFQALISPRRPVPAGSRALMTQYSSGPPSPEPRTTLLAPLVGKTHVDLSSWTVRDGGASKLPRLVPADH